jgi:DNA-binding NarL/FixJ family response regulator
MLLFITDDLVFPSRVRGAAQPLGVELKVVRPADIGACEAPEVALAFIDLATTGSTTAEVICAIRQRWPQARTVAFGPHVDVALLQSAQEAGCEMVLPRSQFAQRLNELVALARPAHS